jgi:CheY-like chemotaxis protein
MIASSGWIQRPSSKERACGYEADDAAAAIRSLELHEEIKLVFTDVKMPGWMNGLALAHYIRRRWPPVKIAVTSGYVNARHDGLPTEALFIEKPYDPAT